ncbi:YoaK family protein [Pantoea sp. EABMAA-21]|uniref:YoaK family protein n=1 Tax=Pantoea sp. EABMAA-21 TaxID=3043302 RepID=UPI0024B4EB71|nr:YoaK family protein [Pantoea sp. EABMAA-21]MDI9280007.1 YoaK family protein [Pantoea sp. EABMAA-21]
MLVKLKRIRSHNEDRKLALCLATSAGLLNAVALGAFGLFPSHMSGNVSQLPGDLSGHDLWHLLIFAAMIAVFISGSVIARIGIAAGIRNGIRTIFSCLLLAEGGMLVLTSLFEVYHYSPANNAEIILLLAFLMGMHNSTSTQLSDGRVRATHITGTLKDAGIAAGSLLSGWLRREQHRSLSTSKLQLSTHLITACSFLGGGLAGVLLYRTMGYSALAVPGIVLISIALLSIAFTLYRTRRSRFIMP